MARRLKNVKKNAGKETNQPKLQKKDAKKEEFEFDIGSLSLADLIRLTEGYVDDESEETVLMTRREMNRYIKNKMEEYSKDPNINPFINLEKQSRILLKEVKLKEQQLIKAKKDFEIMYRKQLKFFRHIGILPKVPTRNVGVSVDFPILRESLPPREFLKKGEEYFVNLPSCKILKPSTSRNSASKQGTNTEESKPKIKVECFDVPSD